MNRQDWVNAYGPVPPALGRRVQQALAHLDNVPAPRPALPRLVLALALLLALAGAAYAVYESVTADVFGWFYGGRWKEELQRGDGSAVAQRRQLGDVTYTLEELVYKAEGEHPGLYGVVRVAPVENANVVLLPWDLSVDDPAGYLLHYGYTGQTIAEDDPSYAELAASRGAKLRMARVAVNSVSVNDQVCTADVGEAWLPQQDGSLLGTMQIAGDVPRAERYELNLWLSNWEVTPEGFWLNDGPEGASLEENWEISVTLDQKGEGK